MKKSILVILLLVVVIILSSCTIGNRRHGLDTVQTFDTFTIVFGGEDISGRVKEWRDFKDSDVIQITDEKGNVYLTHYMNALLVRTKR